MPCDCVQSFDDAGKAQGCKTSCSAEGGDQNCCTGEFNSPERCASSGVSNYKYFKDACPDAYAYAFDESSGTALWGCNTSPNYTGTSPRPLAPSAPPLLDSGLTL